MNLYNSSAIIDKHRSKISMWLFIIFVLLFIMCLNFPVFIHPREGMDNYFYVYLSEQVVKQHTIPWLLHPSSFFGLYPFSTPPAYPVLLGEIKALTTLNNDAIVILVGDLFMFSSAFMIILISIKLTRRFLYSFVMSLILINAPYFFNWSWNTVTSRILLIVAIIYLILIHVTIGIKFKNKPYKRRLLYMFFLLFMLLFLLTIHRTAIIIIFSYIMAGFLLFIYIIIKHLNKITIAANAIAIRLIYLCTIMFSFLLPFINNFGIRGYNGEAYAGGFFHSSETIHLILNFIISMVGGTGLILASTFILGLVALIFLKNTHNYTHYDFLVLGILNTLLLFSPSYLYVRGIMPIIFTLIAINAIMLIKNHPNNKHNMSNTYSKKQHNQKFVKMAILASIVFLMIANNFVMQAYWLNKEHTKLIAKIEGNNAPQSVFEIGIYFRYTTNKSAVIDSFVDARWIQYYSGGKILPPSLGFSQDINYVLFYSKNISVKPLSIEDIIKNPRGLFGIDYLWTSPEHSKIISEYIFVMNHNVLNNYTKKILKKYNTKYAINQNMYPHIYFYWDQPRQSSFYSSLSKEKYITYINQRYTEWLL